MSAGAGTGSRGAGPRAGWNEAVAAGTGSGARSRRPWDGDPDRSPAGPPRAFQADHPLHADRPVDPYLPDDVEFRELDREVRARLRGLTKEQAERVGKHLVMVARLIDDDPELAYQHAQAAVRRAGRIDVAHEAAGLSAYRSGRYAEALRELRTVRRLNGSPEHLPVIADAERGLGRPERAIVVGNDPEVAVLSPDSQVELAMVLSGARLDLGEPEAALALLETPVVRAAVGVLAARVAQARATALTALGRTADADRELSRFSQDELDAAAGDIGEDEEVFVYDLLDEEPDEFGQDAADEPVAPDREPAAEPAEQGQGQGQDAVGDVDLTLEDGV